MDILLQDFPFWGNGGMLIPTTRKYPPTKFSPH